jgi:hypothetical protein
MFSLRRPSEGHVQESKNLQATLATQLGYFLGSLSEFSSPVGDYSLHSDWEQDLGDTGLARGGWSGLELVLIQSREQFLAGVAIELARDLEAVAGLEGTDRRLRLSGEEAIDQPRVQPKVS